MSMKVKDCFIFGTRPEIIKFAPLILKMEEKPFLIHSGQHQELVDETLKIFRIEPDVNLKILRESKSLAEIISQVLKKTSRLFKIIKPKRVWVEGDTATALAGALAASSQKIKLVHLEAGLRSFDKRNPFPEEIYRIAIDHLADILFAPTEHNAENLKRENVSGKIFTVGNTIVDSLKMIRPLIGRRRLKEKYLLVTVHRRETWGKPMQEIFEALKIISKRIKIIFPCHPNPRIRKIARRVGLRVYPPFDYKTFLIYLSHCEFILTDSGGVQEEAPSFGKYVLVLRRKTERPELISAGFGRLVGWNKEWIIQETMKTLKNLNKIQESLKNKENPFGDGRTTERILKLI